MIYMNPVFIFLVLLGAIALWFMLSWAFKPIGTFLTRIFNDAKDEIIKDESEDNE